MNHQPKYLFKLYKCLCWQTGFLLALSFCCFAGFAPLMSFWIECMLSVQLIISNCPELHSIQLLLFNRTCASVLVTKKFCRNRSSVADGSCLHKNYWRSESCFKGKRIAMLVICLSLSPFLFVGFCIYALVLVCTIYTAVYIYIYNFFLLPLVQGLMERKWLDTVIRLL